MNTEERQLRAKIAYDIRAELVCCDMYDQVQVAMKNGGEPHTFHYKDVDDYHAICHWGEAAARIAENRSDDLPVGLCDNKEDHVPHDHESGSLGRFWCSADQTTRLPYAAEKRRRRDNS